MRSWRTSGLALWALAAILVTGCSSTSIPARVTRLATGQVYESERVPHSRLIAIGKTFEAQGKYSRAKRMYRMVLSQKPGHSQAIASLNRLQNMHDGQLPAPNSVTPVAPQIQQPQRMLAKQMPIPPVPKPDAPGTATFTALEPEPAPTRTVSTSKVVASTAKVDPAPAVASKAPVSQPIDAHEEHEWKLPVVTPAITAPSQNTGRVSLGNLGGPEETESGVSTVSASTGPASTGAEDLMELMDDPASHLARLIAELESEDEEVRSMSAFLIGEAGPDAIAAATAMRTRLTTDSSEAIRVVIAEALGKMNASDDASREVLMAGLKSTSTDVRSASAFALRVFKGEADPAIIDGLKLALADSEESVAAMAALSLSDFGPQARSAIQVLEAVRPTGSPELQQAIDSALGRIRK